MKLKHKLFSILLSLALICLLIPALQQPAKAANATSVTITGITLSSGKYLTENGTVVTSRPASGGYAWFSSAGSLSLHDFKVGISGVRGISANGNLSIYLYGDNYIRTNTNHYAIYADGNVYIYGMDSGKLAAYSDEACAIYATGSVTLNSGDVEAVSYGSNVINAQAAVLIKGGTLDVISTTGDYPAIWAKTSINISGGDTTVTAPASAINCSSGYVTISGGRVTADSSASNGIYANGTVNLNGGITYIEGGLHGIRAGYCKVTGGYHKVTSTNTEKDSSYSAFSPTDGDKTKFIVDTDATAVGSNSATSANMVKVETTNLFNYDRLECGNYVKVKGIPVPAGWYLKQGETKAEHGTTPSANYAYFSGTTLTLDNFTSSTTNTVGIEAEKDIELFLRGTSSFSTGSMLAIDVDGEVIVEEYDSTGGSLSLTGSSHLVKITGELELNEGTVTCVGGGNTVDLGRLNIDGGMLTVTSTNLGIWVRGNVELDNGTLAVSASGNNGIYIEGNLKLNSGAANISSAGSIGCCVKGTTTISTGNHECVGYTDGLYTSSLSVTGGYVKVRSTNTASDSEYWALKVPVDQFTVGSGLSASGSENGKTLLLNDRLIPEMLAKYDSVFIGDYIYVNNIEVRSGEYLGNGYLKASTTQPSGGYAYYNAGRLTLNNYSCNTTGATAVRSFRDLALTLIGTNTLTSDYYGIFNYGALTITGNGSLTANTKTYTAIHSKNTLSIAANVTAKTTTATCITSDDKVLITSGTVRAESQSGDGVYGTEMVSCAGGKLIVNAEEGIRTWSTFNLNGGTVEITAQTYGVNASDGVVSNGGSLTVTASNGTGINSKNGKILINGGSVTVTGSVDGVNAVGLNAGSATLLSKSTGSGMALNLTGADTNRYYCASGNCATASASSTGAKTVMLDVNALEQYRYVYIRPIVLKVRGVTLKDGDYLPSGSTTVTTTKPSGGYAYYKDKTLTLNNYKFNGSTVRGIECTGSLNITLLGSSSFVTGNHSAIYVEGQTEFDGDGTLDLATDNEPTIHCINTLMVADGSLLVSSSGQQAFWIPEGDLIISGGAISAYSDAKSGATVGGKTFVTGGVSDFAGRLCGISTSKFAMTGGELTVYSTNGTDSWEALAVNSSEKDAFTISAMGAAEASVTGDVDDCEKFNAQELSNYNYVHFKGRKVVVGNVQMLDGTYLPSGGDALTTTEPADGYAYYNDGKLELYNFSDLDCMDYGIDCDGDLQIQVIGANALYGAIEVDGNLTVEGNGWIDINAPFYGIKGQESLTLKNVEIHMEVTAADSIALTTDGMLTLDSAHVDITCVTTGGTAVGAYEIIMRTGSLKVDSACHGVFSSAAFIINEGVVNIDADASGMYCDELIMYDADVTVIAQQNGLEINSFQMDFGTLSVQSTNGSNSHCAIAMGSPEFTLNSELIMRGNETTYGTLREITRDEISSMDRIEISSHVCTLIYVDELPAACEANGKEGYFYCECGKFFIDGEGLMPIEDPENWGIIPATGHNFAAVGYDESWHWNYCSVCGDQDTESFGLHDIGEDGSCYMCGYVAGFKLSGSLTTFGSDEDFITMRLLKDGVVYAVMDLDGNLESYCFDLVAPGEYILEVSKKNHVTREYTVTVGSSDVTQDAKIHLKGDVTGDGKVNVGDTSRVYAHVKGTSKITDEYALKCADVSGDGKINVGDTSKIYAHVKGTSKLW